MPNLVLANSSYQRHMTDEGDQLQRGLEAAGWSLAGFGYGDDCRNVPRLLERFQPETVFVQDVRDWRTDSPGCFDRRVELQSWRILGSWDGQKVTVCKDAGTAVDLQRQFAGDIGADAIAIYYHPESVLPLSPWLADYPLIRIYHSVDADECRRIPLDRPRHRAILTGAINRTIYPLRSLAQLNHEWLGLDLKRHPGYSDGGTMTHHYLRLLASYRVHLATASRYGFALRKILESVAVGAIPVTDLPAYDRLPFIDGALLRVRRGCTLGELKHTLDTADEAWNLEERRRWAELAWQHYDFRAIGRQLSESITEGARCKFTA
jgi:hypothetical protein